MRATNRAIAVGLIVSASILAASSCNLVARHRACDVDPDCDMTGAGGSGGGGGTIDPGCIPSANSEPVETSCGVFVASAGDDASGDGSQSAPVKTLAKALELAETAGKPVYACAESFAEVVTVPAGLVVYGGLDCGNGWRYAGGAKRTRIEPDADAIGLRFAGGEGATTRVEDVVVTAKDATLEGGSSIAALAESGASVELVRCELHAGRGANGAMGMTPSDSVGPTDPNDMTIRGVDGAAACMGNMSGNLGGAGKLNEVCPGEAPAMVVGGDGGTGLIGNGENGADGQPLPDPNPDGWGVGGKGETATPCKAGAGGLLGVAGVSGAGAATTALGMLSVAGIAGASGEAGADGAPGQGGGGGGGAKGKVNCNGASGGGGGAGGCGGKGGLGGQAGGSSVALVSLGATLTFVEVTLTASDGGTGGDGGEGQAGAIGGAGGFGGVGSGTLAACDGGKGGQGGFGGRGGGGRGGHALGIAYTGATPPSEGITIETGTPGLGGAGADAAGQGADGVTAPMQAFP